MPHGINDRGYNPYEPHQCNANGATDKLFQRFPHHTWFEGCFVFPKSGDPGAHVPGDPGAHVPIDNILYETHKGHFHGLFRNPLKLHPSQYLRARRPPGNVRPPLDDLDFSTSIGKANLLAW